MSDTELSEDLNSDFTSESDTESDFEIPSFNNLKPYDFEPICEPRQFESCSEVSTTESSRIGNTSWCFCGKCRAMETEEESYCCLDTNEVPEHYFEG